MRRWVLLLLGAALLPHPLLGTGSRQARYLNFTAVDRNEVLVRDLRLEEISLFLDGEPVPVRYLGQRNLDTAFLFLIENSPRTARFSRSLPHLGRINTVDRIRFHLMNGFFRPLTEVGPVLLAEFYQNFKVIKDFTVNDDELEYALHQMSPAFRGTDRDNVPVARMMGRALDLLAQRRERRKVLVVFCSTVDRESYRSLEEYQMLLREEDIDLYPVSFALKMPTGPGFSHQEKMNRFYFRRLAGETSGKAYISGEYVFSEEFFNDLRTRLAHIYTIGFYVEAEARREGEHRVRLEIGRPGLDLQYRKTLVY